MIKAIKNGQEANFTERAWELLPQGKDGWTEVQPEPPAEVKTAMKTNAKGGGKKAETTLPEPPAEVVNDGEMAGEPEGGEV